MVIRAIHIPIFRFQLTVVLLLVCFFLCCSAFNSHCIWFDDTKLGEIYGNAKRIFIDISHTRL